jgi:polyisoprenoid-binding protein YceI
MSTVTNIEGRSDAPAASGAVAADGALAGSGAVVGSGAAAGGGLPSSLRGTEWRVDVDHTTIEFRVRHAGVAKVRGVFREFEGSLVVGDDGAARGGGSVDVASLDTRIGARDEHLRSADFFDVERHPRLTFTATSITHEDGELRVVGDLTIKGITREIELTGELAGTGIDDEGNERVGLELSGRLDRRDYGLTWNAAVDGGGLLVGNRVDLQLDVSAVRVTG